MGKKLRKHLVPQKPRINGMSEKNEDRMLMFLQVQDQFDAINLPLRVRKAAYRLEYTTHFPTLYLKSANSEPEAVAMMNTQAKRVGRLPVKSEELQIINQDVIDRLNKIDCELLLSYDVDPKTQRKRVKLQLASRNARTVRHTLWWLWKGEVSPWLDEFVVPEH